MEDKRQAVCDRCRKFVPLSDIKYIPKGKDQKIMLCSACRAKGDVASEKSAKKEDNKKIYICYRCNYKFKADPKAKALRCPYCGKDDKLEEYKFSSAESLIKESEGVE